MRLIDADKLLQDIEHYHLSDGKFQHWVEVQPVVTINDSAEENKVTNCNHNADVGKKDLIDRQAAIVYACSGLVRRMEDGDWRRVADIREDLESLPSAKPERKMGNWITTFSAEDAEYVTCDRCKTKQVLYYGKAHPNFCPECGCDMRGNADEMHRM